MTNKDLKKRIIDIAYKNKLSHFITEGRWAVISQIITSYNLDDCDYTNRILYDEEVTFKNNKLNFKVITAGVIYFNNILLFVYKDINSWTEKLIIDKEEERGNMDMYSEEIDLLLDNIITNEIPPSLIPKNKLIIYETIELLTNIFNDVFVVPYSFKINTNKIVLTVDSTQEYDLIIDYLVNESDLKGYINTFVKHIAIDLKREKNIELYKLTKYVKYLNDFVLEEK